MKAKRLTKVEQFILLHTGPTYNFYRCPEHGVFAEPKTKVAQGKCWRACPCQIETISDPIAYAG